MEILQSLRKEKGLSQKAVAKMLGMSETGYASWEQGRAEPSIQALKKLCAIYEITTDYLLGLENDDGSRIAVSAPQSTALPKLTKQEQELLTYFRALDQYEQGRVVGYAEDRAKLAAEINKNKLA